MIGFKTDFEGPSGASAAFCRNGNENPCQYRSIKKICMHLFDLFVGHCGLIYEMESLLFSFRQRLIVRRAFGFGPLVVTETVCVPQSVVYSVWSVQSGSEAQWAEAVSKGLWSSASKQTSDKLLIWHRATNAPQDN